MQSVKSGVVKKRNECKSLVYHFNRSVGEQESLPLPRTWKKLNPASDVESIPLSSNDPEYLDVVKKVKTLNTILNVSINFRMPRTFIQHFRTKYCNKV